MNVAKYFVRTCMDKIRILPSTAWTISVSPRAIGRLGRPASHALASHVWHAAKCEKGGKMLTIFKNGRFDEYLEKLSQLADSDFEDAELMKSISAAFDIYED